MTNAPVRGGRAALEPGVIVVPDEAEALEPVDTTQPQLRVRVRLAHPAGTESQLVAELYAGALREAGFEVQIRAGFSSPAAVFDAVQRGSADVAVLGVATAGGAATASGLRASRSRSGVLAADPSAGAAILRDRLKPVGVTVLVPSTASPAPVVVVRAKSGEATDSIDDLRSGAAALRLGAPETCDEHIWCALTLRQSYGLRFNEVVPLDGYGLQARRALESGRVDAALLSGTDPSLAPGVRPRWVVLDDPRYALPADNLVPLVRTITLTIPLRIILDTVSSTLTTDDLRVLNRQIESDKVKPVTVARAWLRESGLGR